MKKISAFLLVVIMSALAVFAAGCKKEDAISVLTLPDKCAFYVGEKVDVTGGKIKLVIGEEEQIVDMTQDMVAYTCDEDGISNISFPDNPFGTSGKKIVTINGKN